MKAFTFVLLFGTLLGFTQIATGQDQVPSPLDFSESNWSFGEIEEGEKAVHTFSFINVSDSAITLTDVRASCGCTTPEWPREAIAAGQNGEIKVVYNSAGRPGRFKKSITITTTATNDRILLYIDGMVTPAQVKSGIELGNLRFDSQNHTFANFTANLMANQALSHTFKVQHIGSRPIQITNIQSPNAVSISYPSRPIFPDDVFEINVEVNTAETPAGFDYTVILITNDVLQPEKTIRLIGTGENINQN